jgi:hypothetical protein
MVTAVPGVPIVGLNPVIVGAPLDVFTVKGAPLCADPAGVLTAIGPVVAPAGTLVTSCVALAEVTVAATPLKVTVFSLGVWLKPVPYIVTESPITPLSGVNSMIET